MSEQEPEAAEVVETLPEGADSALDPTTAMPTPVEPDEADASGDDGENVAVDADDAEPGEVVADEDDGEDP